MHTVAMVTLTSVINLSRSAAWFSAALLSPNAAAVGAGRASGMSGGASYLLDQENQATAYQLHCVIFLTI